ncbi:hypothetical protein N474_00385 [Pseudoalteromonas luteoviolacea CPMOR-2]|uniref:Uncharacterized protein n=1 Tax=Pseudoalteromonas luteoviolacea DSM 6061 TaxID=1365250 RepID=A0A166WPZ1_9GAMM|nr:hypothetical protein N475_02680 [Pseudoalteromonas luteoviolacea DSM 6061]KZN60671.1 hypothetical protein N474_00385 [Pseudoalteromonas luteoviolacea CPMOR-2]MBE0386837.1 hypothetical protein [Pseudoalteromonas luteoviolacea DSM 6061]
MCISFPIKTGTQNKLLTGQNVFYFIITAQCSLSIKLDTAYEPWG